MIGKLKGTVDSFGEDWVILDVQGVGYQVHCSTRTMGTLPAAGEAAQLAIETHVRETEIKLYGFTADLERNWFRLLQNVQGVGARVALAILGTLTPGEIASAIALQDKATVARAPGVGPKVAQRIVAELKDKAPALSGDATGTIGLQQELGAGAASSAVQDAVSALTNLGYSSQQASAAVKLALDKAGDDAPSATLIRMGLKELSS
ncbi:Holliday junction branch migration protein RuvA [Ahrensia sp. R2A130]|uniref:Holliday junction branch migration protein RuvA n=1 Tax=Ahrensia sp. R2A130 TaxID=744979 RepID=UPI0001E0B4CB|nr:Holliday junction branch migration protein RuvA [Ahrensia sp. R2A130]EFL88709.1 holliday junction DNA helicase RuvA [Ahrensia sp. R2A130]